MCRRERLILRECRKKTCGAPETHTHTGLVYLASFNILWGPGPTLYDLCDKHDYIDNTLLCVCVCDETGIGMFSW